MCHQNSYQQCKGAKRRKKATIATAEASKEKIKKRFSDRNDSKQKKTPGIS
jgi:hypothetical protein